MNNDLIAVGVIAVIVGATFAYLWRKGHLLKMTRYVAETREELRKCNWPTWGELKGSTLVVMVSIALLGVLVVVVDFLILKFMRGILPKL